MRYRGIGRPMRDAGGSVDEVVARSNAVVLRESKPLQHIPKQDTPKEYAAKSEPRAGQDLAAGNRQPEPRGEADPEEMSRKLRDQ